MLQTSASNTITQSKHVTEKVSVLPRTVTYICNYGAPEVQEILQQLQVLYSSLLSFLQDLLTRVEEAVDKFLYWDEEVTIIEAVTSVSVHVY